MTLSPTALEAAAKAVFKRSIFHGYNDEVKAREWARTSDLHRNAATAAITAYLAQAEKEGWVMVRGAEVDGLRSALKGLSDMYTWAWDKVDGGLMMSSSGVERFEKAHQRAYEVLYPDRPLITDEDEGKPRRTGVSDAKP